MSKKPDNGGVHEDADRVEHDGSPPPIYTTESQGENHTYAYSDSRKLGVTGSVFLILNKMIGTGSTFFIRAQMCCN